MKNLLYFMCGLLFLYSCKAELIDKRIEEKSIERTSSRIKNDREMAKSMLRFSEIFSEAISKHVELRQFIKAEALKEFNNDYDVFYPFVKNENVLNDRSFRELLIDYSSEKEILDIEDALPLLTIYVPELPSGFDAETWDFVNEKPYVTATVIQNDHMKFYKDGSLHDSINKLYIPGFPVLVVKNNERVRLKSDSFPRLKSSNITTKESYEFVDDAYNGSIKSKGIVMPGSSYLIPEVITAYDSMGVSGYTWQRDHIYYGLTLNTVDRGPLNHRIIERIVALGFSSDAYFAMSDQPGDPKIKGGFYHKKIK